MRSVNVRGMWEVYANARAGLNIESSRHHREPAYVLAIPIALCGLGLRHRDGTSTATTVVIVMTVETIDLSTLATVVGGACVDDVLAQDKKDPNGMYNVMQRVQAGTLSQADIDKQLSPAAVDRLARGLNGCIVRH